MDDFVKLIEQFTQQYNGIANAIHYQLSSGRDFLYAPLDNDSMYYINLAYHEQQEVEGMETITVVFRISREYDGYNPRYVRVVGVILIDPHGWYGTQWGILHEVKAVERMVTFYESLDAPA